MSLSPAASPPSSLSPEDAVAALADPSAPYLIGVRHHAPSLAAAVPALLDAAAPDVLLVELPAEMQEWLPWLGHEETRAPVALAAASDEAGGGPAFYPFADFSPELAAVRWAARHGVRVVACDLPLADRAWRAGGRADTSATSTARTTPAPDAGRSGITAALRSRLTGRPGEDLWDRLVEATAPGSEPEALRRAALLTGWALREEALASGGVPELDLRRERWMRSRLADATADGARAAVVVGAFHAPALVDPAAATADDRDDPGPPAPRGGPTGRPGWTTSLIPYTYALLDERSGYPAGIRDPEWQHLVLRAAGDPAALEEALTGMAVRVCARLRELGHPSGPPDAREIARFAADLARLRGCPPRAGESWSKRCRRCSRRASRTAGDGPSPGRWNRCSSGPAAAVPHRARRAAVSLPRSRPSWRRSGCRARGPTGLVRPPGTCVWTPCGPTSTANATCCCAA